MGGGRAYSRKGLSGSECLAFAAVFLCSSTAWAQEGGNGAGGTDAKAAAAPVLSVQPRFGFSQTWTDNNRLSSVSRDSALMTTLTPGISVRSNRGAVRGSLDYSLSGVLYTKSEEKNRFQQQLSSRAVAELISNVLFLDATASISQQAASAFGTQTVDVSLANANRREVASVSVSPRLQGRLGSFANLELRANTNATNVKDTVVGDSHSNGGSLKVSRALPGALSWTVQASTQKSSFKAGGENRVSSLIANLGYKPDVDWQLGVLVGRERSDLKDYILRNSATYGANVAWSPSPRTKLAADFQSHDYGDAFSYSLEQRWARSALRFSDSQSVNAANLQNAVAPQSNFDLYMFQFASLVPDVAAREAFVRNFLLAKGLSPDAIAGNTALNTGPTVVRNQLLSFSVQGLRTTVTATANRSNSRRLASAAASAGDFALTGQVKTSSTSVNIAHTLTPNSSAILSLVQQDSSGDSASQSSTLRSITATWNSRLGTRSTISLGARAAHFKGFLPYREHALFANLVQQF